MTERLTQEKVERILKACRKQKFYVKALEETREEILSQMASLPATNYDKPHVQASTVSDLGKKVEAAHEKLHALDNKVADAISMLAALKDDAIQAINLCDSNVQAAVLTDYYVNGYEWDQVATRTNYSEWHVFKIRLRAVQAIVKNSQTFGGET